MLIFLIIAAVLIGIAYADYCLIDNTEHFGISFTKAAEGPEGSKANDSRTEARSGAAESLWNSLATRASEDRAGQPPDTRETETVGGGAEWEPTRPRTRPRPDPLVLLELEPVLELHEAT